MQSTGQTSRHASQPVQLSALMIATSLGNFLRAPDLAMIRPEGSCCWRRTGWDAPWAERTLCRLDRVPASQLYVSGSVTAVLVFTTLMVATRIPPSSPTLHLFFRLDRVKNQPRGGSEFSHGLLQTCSC